MHCRLSYQLTDITPDILALKRINRKSHRIHNAGVGGSSPPVATIYFYRITHPLMQPSLGADSLLIDSYLKRVSLQFEAFVELTNANFKVPNPDTY